MKNTKNKQKKPENSVQLTPKQKNILDFIQTQQNLNGYSPTQHEIAKHFGFSSLGTVQNYLVRLTRSGFLNKAWNAKRDLNISKNYNKKFSNNQSNHNHVEFNLPLLGRVAAGYPIEAIVNPRTIEVPKAFVHSQFAKLNQSQFFVLEVQGDSMIDDGILNGDFIVVRKTEHAINGDLVIALIDNEATLKRFKKTDENGIELIPANSKYKPIKIEEGQDFRIQGIFSGLMRFPE